MNPAEFGNLAARHNFVGIAEACRKEADACTMDGIRNCYSDWETVRQPMLVDSVFRRVVTAGDCMAQRP